MKSRGSGRDRIVAAALEVVQEEGLEALSMRTLADRMGVKAASLYWHVRDREELVELLADAVLREVRLREGGEWRASAHRLCTELAAAVGRHRDAARLLLSVPGVLERSPVQAGLTRTLVEAGLRPDLAQETATLMLVAVLAATSRPTEAPAAEPGRPVQVNIDTGSRGVTLRAGPPMVELLRAAHDPTAPAPAIVRGDVVIVRRRRGMGSGEVELNPAHPWRVKVQAPTWNTVLHLAGLDLREIHLDSGAVGVEAALPAPRGSVPIHVSSGVVDVRLRRPPGVPVVADLSTGAVQIRLDAFAIGATTGDVHWESSPGAAAGDHYRLRISSGAWRVTLEEDAALGLEPAGGGPPAIGRAGIAAALDLVLDGVASRISR
ncbi:MAG TPA: TetR family transcriptional regulator [Candidatus Dormibacteraeota bacterium]